MQPNYYKPSTGLQFFFWKNSCVQWGSASSYLLSVYTHQCSVFGIFFYFAAVLVGRNTGLAGSSVRLSVCPVYQLLTRKRKGMHTKTKIGVNVGTPLRTAVCSRRQYVFRRWSRKACLCCEYRCIVWCVHAQGG